MQTLLLGMGRYCPDVQRWQMFPYKEWPYVNDYILKMYKMEQEL